MITSLLRKEASHSSNLSLHSKPDSLTDNGIPIRGKSKSLGIQHNNKSKEEIKSISNNDENHGEDDAKNHIESLNKINGSKDTHDGRRKQCRGDENMEKKNYILDSKYKFLINFINNFTSEGTTDSEKILTYVRSMQDIILIVDSFYP